MAGGRIKGLTVTIDGDTTGLSKALQNVEKNLKNTQTQLKDVEKLLKLDPKNTELLAQKQRLLADAVSSTSEKLETLKKAITKETSLFSDSKLEIVEIGDGNINRVFRAAAGSGEAYIVKYASSQTNISSSIRLNKARGRIESDYLKIIGQLMPLRVPVVYEYSEKNHYIIMQDLSKQYKVLQGEIASGKQYVFLAKQLAEYVAVSGYAFSGFSLLPDRKLMLQKQFSNQQMCELTERLVFTEPYFDHPLVQRRI